MIRLLPERQATRLLPCFTAFCMRAGKASSGTKGNRVSGTAIDQVKFREVLGSYPTGVCAITALAPDGTPAGFVVGTFISVSLDPPLVGFLPDKSSTSWPVIEQAGHFCVNVLASDQQQVCRQMAAKGADKFAGLGVTMSNHRLPMIGGAIAYIECAIYSVSEAGDHWFVVGRVLGLEVVRDEDPMLFHRGRYGGFAQLA